MFFFIVINKLGCLYFQIRSGMYTKQELLQQLSTFFRLMTTIVFRLLLCGNQLKIDNWDSKNAHGDWKINQSRNEDWFDFPIIVSVFQIPIGA